MPASPTVPNGAMHQWVVVRAESPGQFTARAVGVPDISATAATRDEALDRVKEILRGLLASGQLVSVDVQPKCQAQAWRGEPCTNDPEELAYLDALARDRQEDLENTLRELDRECSNSSWTPTAFK